MTSAAACRLNEIEIELRIICNNDGMRRKRIKIFHPLTDHARRDILRWGKRPQSAVQIIGWRIEGRHIDSGNMRKTMQKGFPRLAGSYPLMIGIHQRGKNYFPLTDHKCVDHLRERLRVKRGTWPSCNNQRIMLCTLCSKRTDTAVYQHFGNMKIIHLKRDSKTDDGKVRKRCLRLHAHHRSL